MGTKGGSGGGGGGGMNWEIGIDMYTLICIKWITNKNLLYKKINKILKFKEKQKTKNQSSHRCSGKRRSTVWGRARRHAQDQELSSNHKPAHVTQQNQSLTPVPPFCPKTSRWACFHPSSGYRGSSKDDFIESTEDPTPEPWDI